MDFFQWEHNGGKIPLAPVSMTSSIWHAARHSYKFLDFRLYMNMKSLICLLTIALFTVDRLIYYTIHFIGG